MPLWYRILRLLLFKIGPTGDVAGARVGAGAGDVADVVPVSEGGVAVGGVEGVAGEGEGMGVAGWSAATVFSEEPLDPPQPVNTNAAIMKPSFKGCLFITIKYSLKRSC